jgi:phytoene dehydrogenase-like protein
VFKSLNLHEHGLEWVHPDIALAHPLDDGSAVTLVRSLEETAAGLGEDGPAYRRIVEPLTVRFGELLDDALGPLLRVPRHPFRLARFGLSAMRSARGLVHAFHGERARAIIAGLSAHAMTPLDEPFTASMGLVFAGAAHTTGWPLARGGSQRIADALTASLRALGGELVVGERITSLGQLGPADAYLFDTSADVLERVAGDHLPSRYRRKLRDFRRGPGIFKVDYALSGPVPWRAPECRRAGTVHLGGTFAEIASTLEDVTHGRHPERPFVLVAQQSLFDPSRAPAGKHTLWTYCHVPNGSTVDMTARIEAQLERFAPGFKDLVLARAVMTPADVEAHNANYRGGDIGGGAADGLQLFARPVLSLDPYATPTKGLYLCSSSTPPGAGVHGMCGFHAARSALRRSFGGRGL